MRITVPVPVPRHRPPVPVVPVVVVVVVVVVVTPSVRFPFVRGFRALLFTVNGHETHTSGFIHTNKEDIRYISWRSTPSYMQRRLLLPVLLVLLAKREKLISPRTAHRYSQLDVFTVAPLLLTCTRVRITKRLARARAAVPA